MGIDPEKLLVLFVIALIVLGPERLPKMARSLGRGLAELRKYTSTVQREVDNVLSEPRSVVRSVLEEADIAGLAGSLRYIDAPSQPRARTAPAPIAPSQAVPAGEATDRLAGGMMNEAPAAAAGDGPAGSTAAEWRVGENGDWAPAVADREGPAGDGWNGSQDSTTSAPGASQLTGPLPDDPSLN
jgi:Tat protein translocase TatB subunit